ncbi:four helix bundle protein [Algoriphagus antarcticus]|uniref:Four helix bundle protein n=1 Tax=Algoriphagus antarcticus TaxID=238540 RepID=A0A3E0DHA7_9BACT|nr:four helix bundle protein [Algoriphagus antarcticus]REG82084.1 four helix bundle protein [Algoriphagus antarcticus]
MAYKKAFELALMIFHNSKQFPKEEKYSLTDQIRRSSRSVCGYIAESYRKRAYPAHFKSKLSDADMENSEKSVWLDFAHACEYISIETHLELIQKSEEVGKLINYMILNPSKFGASTK